MKKWELVWILFGIACGLLVGCGVATSQAGSGAQDVIVPGPGGGVTCYAILDGNGNAVGGNCQ